LKCRAPVKQSPTANEGLGVLGKRGVRTNRTPDEWHTIERVRRGNYHRN
jgi:hypothetical protein